MKQEPDLSVRDGTRLSANGGNDIENEIGKLAQRESTPAIGRMAAVSLSRCAEQTAKDVEATIERVRAIANDIEADGRQLIKDLRERSSTYEERIEAFSRLSEKVALSMRAAGNDVSTFGNDL